MSYPFLKGHGTENDFVLLPDPDGSVHGDLGSEAGRARVRALCDRRAGIGGDGVLRVVRTAVADPAQAERSVWFMDYRNADGSVSEMCGNGIRLFAEHLAAAGLVEPGRAVPVGTWDGVKILTPADGGWTVDLGEPVVHGPTQVGLPAAGPAVTGPPSAGGVDAGGERTWWALHVSTGNPHAVAFLDPAEDLAALSGPGRPLAQPSYDAEAYPDGVNVEFAVRRADGTIAVRVHERGSGETRSCGTGAGAVAVAAAVADAAARGSAYRIEVPGGSLAVTWTAAGRLLLTGPAVLVAAGQTDL